LLLIEDGCAAHLAQRADSLAERRDCVLELTVREVGSRSEPQDPAAMVGKDAALPERNADLAGPRGAEGEETGDPLERRRSVAVDGGRVQVESVELPGQEADLMLAHLA
jgi:hypothetical protein